MTFLLLFRSKRWTKSQLCFPKKPCVKWTTLWASTLQGHQSWLSCCPRDHLCCYSGSDFIIPQDPCRVDTGARENLVARRAHARNESMATGTTKRSHDSFTYATFRYPATASPFMTRA